MGGTCSLQLLREKRQLLGLESGQVKMKTKFLYNKELSSSSKFLWIMDPVLLSFIYLIIIISARQLNGIRIAIYQNMNAYSEFQVSSSGFLSNYKMPLLDKETELPDFPGNKYQLQSVLLTIPVNIFRALWSQVPFPPASFS